MIDWLIGWLLVEWLIDCLIEWMNDLLIDMIDCSDWLINLLIDWLIDYWLIDMIDWSFPDLLAVDLNLGLPLSAPVLPALQHAGTR